MAELRVPHSDHWVHDSAAVGARFRVSLTTPLFPTDAPVPLLVLLDGDTMLLTATEAARTISISTLGALGPVAMVGLMRDTASWPEYFSTRFRDFTPVEWTLPGPFAADNALAQHGTGGADALLAAIVDEIVPDVRRRIRVDDGRIGVCGWSLSGLFAAYAWRERPDVFADLVAISPSLWWNGASMLDETIAARPSEHRVVITAGEHEEGDLERVWPRRFAHAEQRELAAMVTNAVRFGEMVAACGATSQTVVFGGEHHTTLVPASISRGLLHLYG
jgi:hypothetical protein